MIPRNTELLNRTIDAGGFTLERGNEVELVRALAWLICREKNTDQVICDPTAGGVHYYDGATGVWRMLSHHWLMGLVQKLDGMRIGSGSESRPVWLSHPRCKGVVNLLHSALEYQRPGFFSNATPGVAFANGFARATADSGVVLEPHNPDNRAWVGIDADYVPWDPEVKCAWQTFLDRIFRDDPERESKKMLLAEFLGACLVGQAGAANKSILLYGEGGNGKSTFMEALRELFPSERTTAIPPSEFGKPEQVIRFAGSLINFAGDLPKRSILESEVFKRVTGGDTLTGRYLYQNAVDFKSSTGHLFSANELPETNDQSGGFWRRWIVVLFNRKFKTINRTDLMANLKGCRDQMYSWGLWGAARWLAARGEYTMPPSSQKLLGSWQMDTDSVRAWAGAETTATAFQGSTTLYKRYRGYCLKMGRRPVSHVSFGRRLGNLTDWERRRTSRGIEYRKTQYLHVVKC